MRATMKDGEAPAAGARQAGSWHGVDFHVLMTLLFRGWGIACGLITLLLVPHCLTPVEQGYFYTFASILALQVFFELGLNQVIIQLVGHEAAHLTFHDDGRVTGEPHRISRLQGLVALLRRWYAAAAMLFFALGGLAGAVFFGRSGTGSLSVAHWAPVWVVTVGLTAVNLFFSPRLAIIEGTGRVGQVSRLRLIQSMLGYGALWLILLGGGALWAVVAVPMASACVTAMWLRAPENSAMGSSETLASISWRRDIFPMQWRIAVSWASGYFIFNLFTPVVFASQGAAAAGQLGMAMSVFTAVTTIGLSWINAKTPEFAMHVSRGESGALNALFSAVCLRSTLVTAALALTVVGLTAWGVREGLQVMTRVAPPAVLFWIAVAAVTNVIVYAAAVYMRAHREEPMLPVSVTGALLTVAVIFLFRDNLVAMMSGYAGINLVVSLPWTWVLLNRYRARHSAPSVSRKQSPY